MVSPGHPRRTAMDHDKLDRLLNDYARQQPEDQVFSDEERTQLQAELAEEVTEVEPEGRGMRLSGHPRLMPWAVGSGALAAAAIVAIALFLPRPTPIELGITVVTSELGADRIRGEARFEVDVSANDVVHAHLAVLDESGGLSVLPEAAKQIDRTGTIGSFRIWPEEQAVLRTYVVVVASREPISVEALAEALPDQLPAGAEADREAQLRRLCADLAERFGWVADFKPVTALSQ